MKEKFIKLLTKVWYSKAMSFVRKHVGKFLIGSLAFLGLVTWLNWSTTYESPLYGEVQVYRSEHGLYMYVEEIKIFENTGKVRITYNEYDRSKGRFIEKTVTFDKDELYYVRIVETWGSSDMVDYMLD